MSRLLIQEDAKNLENILKGFKGYQPLLQSVKDSYEDMGSEFSGDVWAYIRQDNMNALKEAYFKDIHAELDASGIRNKVLRANALAGIEVPFARFEEAVEKLVNHEPYQGQMQNGKLELTHISYLNGEFLITDEDVEGIREAYCRMYLNQDDQEAVAIWEDALMIAEIATRLKQKVKKVGFFINPLNDGWLTGFIQQKGEDQYTGNIDYVNLIARSLKRQK